MDDIIKFDRYYKYYNRSFKRLTMRSFLYWLARLMGDVNAINKGRVGKRISRRIAGRITGKGLRRLFK